MCDSRERWSDALSEFYVARGHDYLVCARRDGT